MEKLPEIFVRMMQLGYDLPESDEDFLEFIEELRIKSSSYVYETESGIDYYEVRITNSNASIWLGVKGHSVVSLEFTPTLSYSFRAGVEEIHLNHLGIPEFLKIWIDPKIQGDKIDGLLPLVVKLPNAGMFKFGEVPYIHEKLPITGILDFLEKFDFELSSSWLEGVKLSEKSMIPVGLFDTKDSFITEETRNTLLTGKLSFISQEKNQFTGKEFWNLQIDTLIGKIVFTYFGDFQDLGLKEGDYVLGIADLYSSCSTVGWKR